MVPLHSCKREPMPDHRRAIRLWLLSVAGLVNRVEVSQYRLATHLILACAIFALLLRAARELAPQPRLVAPARLRASANVLLALVLVQIYLGALVAGIRGGLLYNTWPL